MIQLSKGVYSCIHKIEGKAICYVGIIDNRIETIIFDTFLSLTTAEEIPRIVEFYELSPIKYVINCHFHNDHIRVNQAFSSEVDIISTKHTLELNKENEPAQLEFEAEFADERFQYYDSLHNAYQGDTTSWEYLQIQMWRPYYEILSKSQLKVQTRLPNLIFENGKSLDGSPRKVQLISKGKGHTERDLILYLPEDKILLSGDLIFNDCHPYLGHGYPDDWKNWLNDMLNMDINTIVPGHGNLCDKEIIHQMADYIETIEILAQKMSNDNIPLENASEIEIPTQFSSWWFDRFFVPNLRFIYHLQKEKQKYVRIPITYFSGEIELVFISFCSIISALLHNLYFSMKAKTPIKVIGINLILFGALFGLVSFNKEFLRPLSTPNSLSAILTGCFPNFIAAYLISLAPINAVIIRKPKKGRLIVYISAIIVFLILSIEEIIPMWGASTYYDLYDIIASAIGSALAILTFEIIRTIKTN